MTTFSLSRNNQKLNPIYSETHSNVVINVYADSEWYYFEYAEKVIMHEKTSLAASLKRTRKEIDSKAGGRSHE